jgi:DNA-binding IclR family transcriptional regulator
MNRVLVVPWSTAPTKSVTDRPFRVRGLIETLGSPERRGNACGSTMSNVLPGYHRGVPGLIQSIERAAAVIRLLAAGSGALRASEIAASLGLAKATTHGILRTLQHVGFVEQDAESGKYQLGAALLHMGSSYLDGNELRTRALNWSDSLAARSHESVRIGTLHENRILIVHHVFRPDDSRQALDVGALVPAHASAMGKMLLASSEYAVEEVTAAGLERFTAATLTDAGELRAALEEVRRRGWAADLEELVEGEVSLAAPIADRRGAIVGAIGISGPVERLCSAGEPRSELVSYVREAARSISRDLGAIPW